MKKRRKGGGGGDATSCSSSNKWGGGDRGGQAKKSLITSETDTMRFPLTAELVERKRGTRQGDQIMTTPERGS